MANRSNGAFAREIWKQFAIVIKVPGEGYLETVKTAPTRRLALGMAFKGLPSGCKVVMCKTADELTRDERGRYDMRNSADRLEDARDNARRSIEFHQTADLY